MVTKIPAAALPGRSAQQGRPEAPYWGQGPWEGKPGRRACRGWAGRPQEAQRRPRAGAPWTASCTRNLAGGEASPAQAPWQGLRGAGGQPRCGLRGKRRWAAPPRGFRHRLLTLGKAPGAAHLLAVTSGDTRLRQEPVQPRSQGEAPGPPLGQARKQTPPPRGWQQAERRSHLP